MTRYQDRRSLIEGKHHLLGVIYEYHRVAAGIESLNLTFDSPGFFDQRRRGLALSGWADRISDTKSVNQKARQSESDKNNCQDSY